MVKLAFLAQGGGRVPGELVVASAAEFGFTSYYCADPDFVPPENVQLGKGPKHNNTSIGARIWSWSTYVIWVAIKILLIKDKPLLVIFTSPPLNPIIGFLAKKLKGQSYVLLIYDMYPEALETFAGLTHDSILSNVWRRLNRLSIKHADRIITISPQMVETLRQYSSQSFDVSQVVLIPTWVDTAIIKPLEKEDNWFAKRHGQVGKFTVLYSGNLGRVHDLTMLPQIASQLVDHPNIHFLIIGDGAGRRPLELECKRMGLQNVTLLPLQEDSTLPFSLATADLAIVALAEGGEGISMPSKTYYMMSAGSAILGLSRENSDLDVVINKYDCGINIVPGDTDGAVRSILELHDAPELLASYRSNARTAVERHFSKSVCIPKLLDEFRPLL